MPRANIRAGHTDAAIGILQQRLAKDPAAVAAGILLTETLLLSPKTNPTLAWSVCPATFAFLEGRVFDAEKAYRAAVKLDAHPHCLVLSGLIHTVRRYNRVRPRR